MGHCNPLVRALDIWYIFYVGSVLLNPETNMNSFQPRLVLIPSGTLSQTFTNILNMFTLVACGHILDANIHK